ncbi:MAG: serine/threonine-protein kinase [Myxococcota bacterium]|nr:serine/threonine-protein kinase [Myxococcota bacterium]
MSDKNPTVFSPKAFGRYLLIERIGEGGMAEIFWAQAQGFGGFEKELVIKRILPHLSEDPDFVEMFLREANLAARLQHPNIVQNYDIGCEEDVYFIAMEYVEGITVKDMLSHSARNSQKLPVEMVVFIARQFLRGLAFVHEYKDKSGQALGLIHRDITPSNVMVSRQGEVKVADFGVAKAQVGDLKTATDSGSLKGKMGYLSPEQIIGEKVDHRLDIFAAGIVLYEMLTSRRLFKGSSDYNTLWLIQNGPVESLRGQRKDVSELLERIVFRALERDTEKRYQNSAQLAEDLDRLSQVENFSFDTKDLGQWVDYRFGDNLNSRRQKINSTLAISLGSLLGDQYETKSDRSALPTRNKKSRSTRSKRQKVYKPVWWIMLFVLGIALLITGVALFRSKTEHGALLLSTVPPGVEVWIDGQKRPESTPQIIEGLLANKEYSLELRLGSYQSVQQDFTLGSGERRTLTFELQPIKQLEVEPLVPKKRNTSKRIPPTKSRPGKRQEKRVAPAKVVFETIAPSLQTSVEGKVPDSKTDAPQEQQKDLGFLFVNTKPWTEVFVNGKSVGNTPLKNFALKMGTYQLVLSNPDAKIYYQEKIEIKTGEQKRIVHRLK